MTTNKPEVFEVYRTRQGTLENVVLLADYEALQAECEKLRKLVTECADYLGHNEHTYISHSSTLHSKLIDAAMQGDQP